MPGLLVQKRFVACVFEQSPDQVGHAGHQVPYRTVGANAETVRGDLGQAVQKLKRESGKGLGVAGVKLALALTELGLIDEYEFVVHPVLAGHGPTLFAGLSERMELELVGRQEFGAGAVALRYRPRGVTA